MIQLENVTKRFEDFIALDGIDLVIPKGSAYGLLGSNGAGKSTILRLLSGVYSTEGGAVTIEGEKVFDNPKVKQKVFFVNDETVQYTDYTLTDLMNYYRLFYPNFSMEKFEQLRSVIKLPMNKKIGNFSKGMKRQAVVITALACQPEYLLLDEAFDGLDPTMRIIVKRMLVDEMTDNNLTVIISSHNLKEIDEFCDTVGLLHKGKIVFNKELDSLKGNVHKVQCAFDVRYDADEFEGLEILHYERKGSVIYLIARGDGDSITTELQKKNPKVLDLVPLSLEEVFVYEMEGLGYDFDDLKG